MHAVFHRWPNVVVQFEDFESSKAVPLLDRFSLRHLELEHIPYQMHIEINFLELQYFLTLRTYLILYMAVCRMPIFH